MKHPDCQWAVKLVGRHVTGAKWIQLSKVGSTQFTVTVRTGARCESDQEVHDREAFLAALHPDIWQARLSRVDSDGESYEIIFSRPRQLDFSSARIDLPNVEAPKRHANRKGA